MVRRKKEDDGATGGIVEQPDFERGIKIIRNDLNPLAERSAKVRGDQSAAWKQIEKDCHLNKKAAKQYHALERTDPELRDDWFRTFIGLCKAGGIGPTRDLVDAAEGTNDGDMIIPFVKAVAPTLATLDGAAAH